MSTAGSAARAEDRRLLQPSQGADEESEYDEAEAMEEDELIGKKEEDEKVCGRFLHGRSRLTHFAGHCCSDQEASHGGTTAKETKAEGSGRAVADQAQGDGQSKGVLLCSCCRNVV